MYLCMYVCMHLYIYTSMGPRAPAGAERQPSSSCRRDPVHPRAGAGVLAPLPFFSIPRWGPALRAAPLGDPQSVKEARRGSRVLGGHLAVASGDMMSAGALLRRVSVRSTLLRHPRAGAGVLAPLPLCSIPRWSPALRAAPLGDPQSVKEARRGGRVLGGRLDVASGDMMTAGALLPRASVRSTPLRHPRVGAGVLAPLLSAGALLRRASVRSTLLRRGSGEEGGVEGVSWEEGRFAVEIVGEDGEAPLPSASLAVSPSTLNAGGAGGGAPVAAQQPSRCASVATTRAAALTAAAILDGDVGDPPLVSTSLALNHSILNAAASVLDGEGGDDPPAPASLTASIRINAAALTAASFAAASFAAAALTAASFTSFTLAAFAAASFTTAALSSASFAAVTHAAATIAPASFAAATVAAATLTAAADGG